MGEVTYFFFNISLLHIWKMWVDSKIYIFLKKIYCLEASCIFHLYIFYLSKFFTQISIKNDQWVIYRCFLKKKNALWGTKMSEIDFRIYTRIDSLFSAGSCMFFDIVVYLYRCGCRTDAMFRPLQDAALQAARRSN